MACTVQSVATSVRVEGDPMLAEAVRVPCRVLVVCIDEKDAEALAAARIARAGSDLLAADCRPVANAIADALVAAGMGQG